MRNLKLIVLENIKEVGEEINFQLKKMNKSKEDYFVSFENPRFSNGEGKVKLKDSIRDSDVYILSDVGNYKMSYSYRGREHYMTPDEHFQDIKRVISAIGGHAERVNVIMPLLYASRQHRRKGRESLDCADSLQELEKLGVNNIITFDAHDPNVVNAIPNLPFENVYPTNQILTKLLKQEKNIFKDILVVAPDFGAAERARYYSEMLGCNIGIFYKSRDLTKIVDGKNPIIEHQYLGPDVTGKNIVVVDDMIASGESMLDVATELKKRKANKIFFSASFALMTSGPDKFNQAYEEGLFNGLYSTNLTYVSEQIKNFPWYQEANCSKVIAKIINSLNNGESLEKYQNNKGKVVKQVQKLKK